MYRTGNAAIGKQDLKSALKSLLNKGNDTSYEDGNDSLGMLRLKICMATTALKCDVITKVQRVVLHRYTHTKDFNK
jgi:hypothetical protein